MKGESYYCATLFQAQKKFDVIANQLVGSGFEVSLFWGQKLSTTMVRIDKEETWGLGI